MFKQVKLGYRFDALEPHIDTLTMETHYGKHHATYTKNFNEAVVKLGMEGKTAFEILKNSHEIEDKTLKTAIINNGGGYYNHNLYFSLLSPTPAKAPGNELMDKITATFGGLDGLMEGLTKAAIGVFGSGWGWITADKEGNLTIATTPNQVNPIIDSKGKDMPIIALDVWEHAYYLKYKNLRADYVKAFFNVLDWAKVDEVYQNRRA